MALLPAHLATMQPWLELAEEIVVVASHSQNGTVRFLREKLAAETLLGFIRCAPA